MKLKHAALLFLLCLTIFVGYAAKEGFRGYDSYYFLSFVCQGTEFNLFEIGNVPPLALMVFSGLPCHVFLLKALLFALFFVGIIIIAATGELIDKEKGWMAGAFALFTPIIWQNAFKLENDSFAFPFIFGATFYFVKFVIQRKRIDFFKSMAAVAIAAGFWGGALYLPLGFALMAVPFAAMGLGIAIIFGEKLLANALPIRGVLESNPTGAIISYVVYILALPAVNSTIFLPVTVFFVGFGLLNPKFSIFAVPFLAILVLEAIKFYPKNFNKFLIPVVIGLSLAWSVNIYNDNPTSMEFEMSRFAVEQSLHKNLDIYNDWHLGYLVYHFGGQPSGWAGIQDLNYGKGIVLTTKELQCTQLKSAPYNFGETGKLFVWECLSPKSLVSKPAIIVND